jgi:predicted O-methyltransferase YrrM
MTEPSRKEPDMICPNEVLQQMYATGQVLDAKGSPRPLHSAIAPAYADALYRFVLRHKPRMAVEIGMSYGASTLSILTALRDAGSQGRLISIDPLQNRNEKGIGLLNVKRSGLAPLHELIEKPSYAALPELLAKEHHIDFAYIDGCHIFDHALLDFFYLDKMMSAGAVIGFNDCGWRSIYHVVKFVQTHRKYEELDVGLSKNYRGRNPLFSALRWVARRSSADRYFRKIENWEPEGSFFKRF